MSHSENAMEMKWQRIVLRVACTQTICKIMHAHMATVSHSYHDLGTYLDQEYIKRNNRIESCVASTI